MSDYLPQIGSMRLRDICIPASHDSGMSKLTWHTTHGTKNNSLTQTHDIAGQLQLGIRQFDIRPALESDDTFWSYHVSDSVLGWVGGRGQSLAEIIEQVNAFTVRNPEIIMLDISHAYSHGDRVFSPLNYDQWCKLRDVLGKLEHIYVAANPSSLLSTRVNQYIGGGQAAVLVTINPDEGDPKKVPPVPPVFSQQQITDWAAKGYYHASTYFPVGSKWSSGAHNWREQSKDQYQAMITQHLSGLMSTPPDQLPDPPPFSLSWAFSPPDIDYVMDKSIREIATGANEHLVLSIWGRCSDGNDCPAASRPFMIGVDNVLNSDLVSLALDLVGVQGLPFAVRPFLFCLKGNCQAYVTRINPDGTWTDINDENFSRRGVAGGGGPLLYVNTAIATFQLKGCPHLFSLNGETLEGYVTRINPDGSWEDLYHSRWLPDYVAVVSFEMDDKPHLFGLKMNNQAWVTRINPNGTWDDLYQGGWSSNYLGTCITSFQLNGQPHIFALKRNNEAWITRINANGSWTDVYSGSWRSDYVASVSFALKGTPHIFSLKQNNTAYITRIKPDGSWEDIHEGSWQSNYVPTCITSFEMEGNPHIFALKKNNEAWITRINADGTWTDVRNAGWDSNYIAIRSFSMNTLTKWRKAALLSAGQFLGTGRYLLADNGAFFAVMQDDGNLCVYKGSPADKKAFVWGSAQVGGYQTAGGSYFAAMQDDGNLCVYKGSPADNKGFLWGSVQDGGYQTAGGSYFAVMQDDGNLCVYKGSPADNKNFVWGSVQSAARKGL
jgi:hypothetical protein